MKSSLLRFVYSVLDRSLLEWLPVLLFSVAIRYHLSSIHALISKRVFLITVLQPRMVKGTIDKTIIFTIAASGVLLAVDEQESVILTTLFEPP